MIAILVIMGTRYACHIFKIKNPFPAKHAHFRSNLKWFFSFEKIAGIRYATYLVSNRKDGRQTWSNTKLIWQARLVAFFYQHGKHT